MFKPSDFFLRAGFVLALFFCALAPLRAQNLTLRIVTYNIEDDISNSTFHVNATAPLPGLIYPVGGGSTTNGGALEGIGEEIVGTDQAQPLDILALEETSSLTATVAPIVAGLNSFYSVNNPLASNMYAMSTYQATNSGGTNDGNGPNALVYNTRTVQLLASVPVDPIGGPSALGSSTGELREVMRYEFAPAGQTPTPATEFYIYVSHYKSGSTTGDQTERTGEANIIRTNESTSLPATARVLYVGDYNISTSTETSYQIIVATNSPTGVAQGQGIDPGNVTGATGIDWTANSLLNLKTEEDYSLHYRDDFQIGTTNIYYGTSGGLALVQGTYHVFGNNGSVSYETAVNNGSDTALTNLAAGSTLSAGQLYNDLVGASDHLPVVADYTIPVIAPVAAFFISASNGPAPLAVTFTDASTGIVTNWFWNFGDGTFSNATTTLSVNHIYTTPGSYTVSETVTGPGGTNTIVATNLITVLTAFQSWQLQYFGCTTCPQAQPGADADGTGQDNLFKYVAGLNPTNPASVFNFSIATVPNQPTAEALTYSPVVTGHSYHPLYSTNLLNGNWLPVLSASAPITNGSTPAGIQVTVTDTNAVLPQEFYEIEITFP